MCGDDPWIEVSGQYLADGAMRVTCELPSMDEGHGGQAMHRWGGRIDGRDVVVNWEVQA